MAKEKYQKEVEQEYDAFEYAPKEEIISTSYFFESAAQNPSPYSGDPKSSRFLNKIVSFLYEWLDEIAGKESHLFLRNKEENKYGEVLSLLQKEGIPVRVGRVWLKYNDMPFFPRAKLIATLSKEITDGATREEVEGFSIGVNSEEVRVKAIGELLERCFLAVYRRRSLTRGSLYELKRKGMLALNLHNLAGFSDEQKKENLRLRWTEDSVFWWEKGIRFSTGKQIYLPAQLIYWNYLLDDELGEPMLREPNTNGCGGMFTKEGAILAGLYELIQRDAFLIHWLNLKAPSKIEPDTVPDNAFQQIHLAHKRYGYKTHCFDITTDVGVPTFAAMLIDSSGKGPYLGVGASASLEPVRALRRAIEEAHSGLYWARFLPRFGFPKKYRPFRDKSVGHRARAGLWANSYMAKYINFFLAGETKKFSDCQFDYPKSFNSPQEELEFLVNRIEKLGNGYEVYFFTLRHPVLSQLGYTVSRVLAPQLFPLYLNEINAPLGSPRLFDVPRKMRWRESVLNTIPHPFP